MKIKGFGPLFLCLAVCVFSFQIRGETFFGAEAGSDVNRRALSQEYPELYVRASGHDPTNSVMGSVGFRFQKRGDKILMTGIEGGCHSYFSNIRCVSQTVEYECRDLWHLAQTGSAVFSDSRWTESLSENWGEADPAAFCGSIRVKATFYVEDSEGNQWHFSLTAQY